MKLGEIKLESLRLMNANDEDLNIVNLDNYRQDDRYKDYLDRMPGAINRAISRFMTYKVIPTKTVEVKPSQGETYGQFLKLNLKKILPEMNVNDFGSLERVIYINERVVPNVDFQTIKEGVILIPFCSIYIFKGQTNSLPEDEIFNIEYTPNVAPVSVSTDNNKELDIPESLARIIPYYVKADLYEQDEPELAATARNIFESALTEYVSFGITRKQRQQYVKNTMF